MILEVFDKVELHMSRINSAIKEIENWSEFDSSIFEEFEKIKTIDSFIYRFIKLQDFMGDKLFKSFLDFLGEYKESMSLLDVVDKLEKFQIIESSKSWFQYRKLRNQLTHEYPNNEEDIVNGIKESIKAYKEIEKIYQNIKNYIISKGEK